MRACRANLPLAVAAVLLLTATGCGAGGESTTVTVIEKTVVEKQAPPAPAEPAPDPKPRRSKRTHVAAPATPEPDTGGSIRVQDVVGADHQLAQDTMQAAGLYALVEVDATGQGRMLLWDRNWVVVEQSPPAGAMVDEDQEIVLSSKKVGE